MSNFEEMMNTEPIAVLPSKTMGELLAEANVSAILWAKLEAVIIARIVVLYDDDKMVVLRTTTEENSAEAISHCLDGAGEWILLTCEEPPQECLLPPLIMETK